MPEIWSRGAGVVGSHLLESFLCQSINSTHQIRIISSSIEYTLVKPNCLEENFLLSKKKKKLKTISNLFIETLLLPNFQLIHETNIQIDFLFQFYSS